MGTNGRPGYVDLVGKLGEYITGTQTFESGGASYAEALARRCKENKTP